MKSILISIISFIISLFKNKQITIIDYFAKIIPIKPINSVIEDTKIQPSQIKEKIENMTNIIDNKVIKPNIIEDFLSKKQYVGKRQHPIKQICIHFTEGGSYEGCKSYWESTDVQIGTNFVIDKDGKIYCTIPEDCWAYQLGIRMKSNQIEDKYKTKEYSDLIEQSTIGIELVNEGGLVKNNKGYFFEGGQRYIDSNKTVRFSLRHRGYFDYTLFTDEQIKSLESLLLYLTDKYNIPKDYTTPFNINKNALNNISGIYTHVCYRTDKTDCAPLPNLVNLLKNLK